METGPQSKSDNLITKKFRLLQSEYRANILKVPYGYGPNKNSKNKFGNMLVDGEKNGLNFITKEAFLYAKQKVLDKQVIKDLTIDEYRLFNNMLSSMPMCFNLFSDLRKLLLTNPKIVSDTIKNMFKEIPWINSVTYIDIEFIPLPINEYINDKTAFDAIILVKSDDNKKGLITIETKYTDILGNNNASNSETKNNILEKYKIFNKTYTEYLKETGYKQIHRNFLLTYIFAKKHNFNNFANVIISPKDDEISVNEINELQDNLISNKDSILKINLEDIVERGIEVDINEISPIMKKFKERYII